MSKFGKIFKVLVLVIAVVGIGLGVGWWASRPSDHGQVSNPNEVASVTSTPANPASPIKGADQRPSPVTDKSNPVIPMPKPQAPATNAPGLPGWEEKIDA